MYILINILRSLASMRINLSIQLLFYPTIRSPLANAKLRHKIIQTKDAPNA